MLAALLLMAAAQADPPMTPQTAVLQAEGVKAGEAWMTCLTEAVEAADEHVRPEGVADAAIAGCTAKQEAMVAATDRFFASALTGAKLAKARAETRKQVAGVRRQLITMVRDSRRH